MYSTFTLAKFDPLLFTYHILHFKCEILKIWSPEYKVMRTQCWTIVRKDVFYVFCGCIYLNLCPYFFKTTGYIVFFSHCYCVQYVSIIPILYVSKVCLDSIQRILIREQAWPSLHQFGFTVQLQRLQKYFQPSVLHDYFPEFHTISIKEYIVWFQKKGKKENTIHRGTD